MTLQTNHTEIETEPKIDNLITAYQIGRNTAVQWNVEWDKKEWLAPLRYSQMIHLPQNEREALAKGKLHCVRARNAAASLDFTSACREIAIAQAMSMRAEFCRETRLLAGSEILAVEATIEFWGGNYPLSRHKLLANSRLDQILEDEFGLGGFHAHRIHLLSKHVQLASFAEGPVEALRIAANAMTYLNGGGLAFADAGDWDQSRVQKLPAGIIRFLIRQLTVEIGAALLYANEEVRIYAVNELCSLVPPTGFDSIPEPMSRCYLRALHLSALPNREFEHLSAAAKMLGYGAKGAETLWLMCALDASRTCAHLNGEAARCFRKQALTDASEHVAFPSDLRRTWKRQTGNASACIRHACAVTAS